MSDLEKTEKGKNDASRSLKGVYDHTIFSNEETGFTVGILSIPGSRQLTTIVGPFTASPGETLDLQGSWIHNKKFGEQFQVTGCEVHLPSTIDGLRKYLGSGLIKGIGPAYADRLIDRFGVDVPSVIEESPHRLREVAGIGPSRAKKIVEGWNSQRVVKDIMVFLQSHGVGTVYATKIYKEYGADAIGKVTQNPYALAADIHGIGFKSADRIAESIGIERNSRSRYEAGILYVLREQSDKRGNVYCTPELLGRELEELLGVPGENVVSYARTMAEPVFSRLVVEKTAGEERIFLRALWTMEQRSAARVQSLLKSPARMERAVIWDKFHEWYAERKKINFSSSQREAIEILFKSKVAVLTGGPGTGKSTLIQALTALYEQLHWPFLLAAPTGRAAKRMAEITGVESKTLHRLLEFDPKNWAFKRNRQNPLDCDLLIVDEVSMIDLPLFDHLLEALPDTARLLLVGDVDQLPSVGPGNILADLINSEVIPVVRLTEIHRQAQGSRIIRAAHLINRGESPVEVPGDKTDSDFYFIEKEDPENCVRLIKELCAVRIPKKFGVEPTSIQVLIPMNRGIVGTRNLNQELQSVLNPGGIRFKRGSREFAVGDRVIQVRNNYDLEVFNGDIGFVSAIDTEEGKLAVDFEGRVVEYEASDLDQLDLAYAISIHKAQGSEFPVVVIGVLTQHAVMLQKNLLYTAVTRGKKLVVVVGSERALKLALSNQQQRKRLTGLQARLRSADLAMDKVTL